VLTRLMLRAAFRRGSFSVVNGVRAAGGFSRSNYDVIVVSYSRLGSTAPHRTNHRHYTY